MSYQEKLRNSSWKVLANDRWQEKSRREERNVTNEWEQNELFCEKNRSSVREIENKKQQGRNMKQKVTKRYQYVKLK